MVKGKGPHISLVTPHPALPSFKDLKEVLPGFFEIKINFSETWLLVSRNEHMQVFLFGTLTFLFLY